MIKIEDTWRDVGNGLYTHTKLTMPLKLMIIAKNVFTLKFCFLCVLFFPFFFFFYTITKEKNKSPKILILFFFFFLDQILIFL